MPTESIYPGRRRSSSADNYIQQGSVLRAAFLSTRSLAAKSKLSDLIRHSRCAAVFVFRRPRRAYANPREQLEFWRNSESWLETVAKGKKASRELEIPWISNCASTNSLSVTLVIRFYEKAEFFVFLCGISKIMTVFGEEMVEGRFYVRFPNVENTTHSLQTDETVAGGRPRNFQRVMQIREKNRVAGKRKRGEKYCRDVIPRR